MALILGDKDELIKVISRVDGSVRCEEEQYEEYLKTLDESLLELDPATEPTRFVMKKIMSQKDDLAVKNETLKVSKDGVPSVQLGFMQKEIQVSLIRIEQPESLTEDQKIKYKTINNQIDSDTISWLDQVGVLKDLYAAKKNSAESTLGGVVKKS